MRVADRPAERVRRRVVPDLAAELREPWQLITIEEEAAAPTQATLVDAEALRQVVSQSHATHVGKIGRERDQPARRATGRRLAGHLGLDLRPRSAGGEHAQE